MISSFPYPEGCRDTLSWPKMEVGPEEAKQSVL